MGQNCTHTRKSKVPKRANDPKAKEKTLHIISHFRIRSLCENKSALFYIYIPGLAIMKRHKNGQFPRSVSENGRKMDGRKSASM